MTIIIREVLQIHLYLGKHSVKNNVLYKSKEWLFPFLPQLGILLILTKMLTNDIFEVQSLPVTSAFNN